MPSDKQKSKLALVNLEGIASHEDVKVLFKQLIDFLKQFKADMQKQMAEHKDGLSSHGAETMNAHMQKMATFEARITAIANEAKTVSQSEVRTLTRMLQQEMKRLEALIPDPTDLSPLTVKIEQSIAELQAKIPSLPEELSAVQVRDKLETLEGKEKLNINSIFLLQEELNKLKAQIGKGTGGGGGGLSRMALQLALGKIIKHQAFSTSSATTTLTLNDKVAGDVALWLRYNGQVLVHGTHYTVSGTLVSLLFTPDDDTNIN